MDNLKTGMTYEQVKQSIKTNIEEIDKLNKDEHMGSEIGVAFNYECEEQGNDELNAHFIKSNWNDPILSKVREAIHYIQENGDEIIGVSYKIGNVGGVSISVVNINDHTVATLTTTYLCDTLGDVEEKVYIVKYYKNRGRTEEVYDILADRNINLWDMVNLNKMLDN